MAEYSWWICGVLYLLVGNGAIVVLQEWTGNLKRFQRLIVALAYPVILFGIGVIEMIAWLWE